MKNSEVMVNPPSNRLWCLVLDKINIVGQTIQVAYHIFSLATLWAKGADCRASWNVRDWLLQI